MRTALAASVLALALGAGCAAPRSSRSSALVGKRVEVVASDLDGREVRIWPSGARATVVDFWATWCEPCRDQLRVLGELAAEVHPLGVDLYAVSFDEDRTAVEEFLARTPVQVPVLWDKGGALLADKLDVTRLPTTIVIDGTGVVRAVHLGFERSARATLEREVRGILAAGPQAGR